ncbi:hypothetical protein D3C78_1445320 [compost metagenome]
MGGDFAGGPVVVAEAVDVGPFFHAAQGGVEIRTVVILEAQGRRLGHAPDQVTVEPGDTLGNHAEGVVEVVAVVLEQQ